MGSRIDEAEFLMAAGRVAMGEKPTHIERDAGRTPGSYKGYAVRLGMIGAWRSLVSTTRDWAVVDMVIQEIEKTGKSTTEAIHVLKSDPKRLRPIIEQVEGRIGEARARFLLRENNAETLEPEKAKSPGLESMKAELDQSRADVAELKAMMRELLEEKTRPDSGGGL